MLRKYLPLLEAQQRYEHIAWLLHTLCKAHPVVAYFRSLGTCAIFRGVRNIYVTSEILIIITFSFDYITYSGPDADPGAVVNAMRWLRRLLYLTAYAYGWADAGGAMGNGGQEHHNSAKVRFNVRNYYAYLLLFCVLNSFVCQHKSNMQAAVCGCRSVCVWLFSWQSY